MLLIALLPAQIFHQLDLIVTIHDAAPRSRRPAAEGDPRQPGMCTEVRHAD
jgi:hypothetical protein